jgi:uncharacterized protein YbjT (DUF2867 family)
MKVLVTGATGYIGAVAADALAAKGHDVLGLARSARSVNALRERGIEPVMGDFGDPASLQGEAQSHPRRSGRCGCCGVGWPFGGLRTVGQ